MVVLLGFALYLALAFGLRTLLHVRATGSTGWKGISGPPGSAEWAGGVLFAVSLAAALAAVIVAAVGRPGPALAAPSLATDVAGGVLFALGALATLWSQAAMGASWRIGVDQREVTAMVTGGPFRWVRNPIFASMMAAAAGLVLLHPTALAAASGLLLVAAVEIQVRVVEEPYLARTHGAGYADYARRVGRFAPLIGRLSLSDRASASSPTAPAWSPAARASSPAASSPGRASPPGRASSPGHASSPAGRRGRSRRR